MLRITSMTDYAKVNILEEEIILNGPPGDLRGRISINNKYNDVLKVKSLPIDHGLELTHLMGNNSAVQLSCLLAVGEQKITDVWHQVHPYTVPGTYLSTLNIGGQEHKVKIIVQSLIEIDIQPSTFTFQGTEPGMIHTCEFTLTNMGNMPFQVPDVKHVATLDMDMLCKAFGMALRENSEGGYEDVLNSISKNVHSSLPDWAKAKVAEGGAILQPGDIQLIHLQITIPKDCNPNQDYNGSMRFWDKDIVYSIKSYNPTTR